LGFTSRGIAKSNIRTKTSEDYQQQIYQSNKNALYISNINMEKFAKFTLK